MSKMNIKTFIEVAKALPPDISILVKGDTGIGKSDVVKQIAAMTQTKHMYLDYEGPGIPVLDWRLSVFSEGDILGLPELVDGVTRFAPNNRFMQACRDPHMLFLDEGNRASPEVLQCAFQIVLDRELNGSKLHPETRIIMAINEGSDFSVNDMDPALARRFWVVELVPTTQDWLDWAAKNGVDPLIRTFIKKYPSHLKHQGERTPGSIYPYPASWARADRSLSYAGIRPSACAGKATPDLMLHIMSGFIGIHTAAAFIDFVRNYELKIGAEDILNSFEDFEDNVKKLSSDKKNDIVDQIILYLKENDLCASQVENLERFMNYNSDEVIVDFIQNLLSTKNLYNIKMVTKVLKPRVLASVRGSVNDKERK